MKQEKKPSKVTQKKNKKCVKEKFNTLLKEWEDLIQEMKKLDLESKDGQREVGEARSKDGDIPRATTGN